MNNLQIINQLTNLNENIKQIVLVITNKLSYTGCLYTYEKSQIWGEVLSNLPVVVGRSGSTEDKFEGDGKSPLGLHKIGHAFGVGEAPSGIKIPYRKITLDDKFIDDPKSPEYNTWVIGETKATSYEVMRRNDNQYDLGLVIDYNMHPVVANKGSAIFMHIWEDSNKGTAGCVAMKRNDLEAILKWLDPIKTPYLYIMNN